MKHLYTLISVTTSLLLFTSCGNSTPVAPSQNDALNKISNSKGKEKSSYMQQGLDTWLEEDWKATVEKDEKIQTKYMQKVKVIEPISITTKEELEKNSTANLSKSVKTQEKYVQKPNKPFTLQEYVNKMEAYNKNKNNALNDSHAQQLKKMPVIGE